MIRSFLPQELIRKKRDNEVLSEQEIRGFITGVTNRSIPDYQAAAMLMAIYFNGLGDRELAAWADAMLHSGDIIDLSAISRPKVDKHSTGGVGDKISIPLAPAVAACGVAVPMISGRGLGHTGGTLDKLESIPGFRVDLTIEEFTQQVAKLGVCLIGQTAQLAPADGQLYALRDVTATVESIPLIASSIMAKKLAESIDGLVLDCKVGVGAFMPDRSRATELARAIQSIGKQAGVPVSVVLSRMDAPIGRTVGNALEVAESIAVLTGQGPSDTRELTLVLGGEMLQLAGVAGSAQEGQQAIANALDSGAALDVMRRVVAAQGGDPAVLDDPSRLPASRHRETITASRPGFVTAINAKAVAVAALVLGAGRRRKEDSVDHSVGIELCVEIGQSVEQGEPLAIVHHNGRSAADASRRVADAFTIGAARGATSSRIIEVLR